jgi:hypothetical protein
LSIESTRNMSKQRKELNLVFKKYKLNRDVHIFQSDDYTKISRQGIQNIQNQEKIQVKYELVHCSSGEAVVKATGFFEAIEYQTFGEASPMNNTFKFPVAIAQKRAQERLILDMVLTEFADIVMGASEIDTQPRTATKSSPEAGAKAEDLTLDLMKGAKKL